MHCAACCPQHRRTCRSTRWTSTQRLSNTHVMLLCWCTQHQLMGKRLLPLQGYSTDLTDAEAVKATVAAIERDLGPISLLFWNPVSTPASLLSSSPEQWMSAYNVTVTGMLTDLIVNFLAGMRSLPEAFGPKAALAVGSTTSLGSIAPCKPQVLWTGRHQTCEQTAEALPTSWRT